MFDAFLFDFDGVLIDSEHLTLDAVHQVLQTYGVPGEQLPQRNYQGWSWEAIHRNLVHLELNVSEEVMVSNYAHAFATLVRTRSPRQIPGVNDALKRASHLGKVGIVTASDGALVHSSLKQHGWTSYVDAVVSADTYDQPKPDPECYLKAARQLGVDISECVIFEDSDVGLKGALASGGHVIAILGGRPIPPDVRIRLAATWPDFTDALNTVFFGGREALQ